MFRFRVGFDERTIDRFADRIHERSVRQTKPAAEQAGQLMVAEARQTAEDEGSGLDREPSGSVVQDVRRPAKELYGFRVIRTSEGHRAFITTVPGATDAEIVKLKSIESGSRPHVIRPRGKALTGWDYQGKQQYAKKVDHPGTPPKNIARRARDRVYQRIRRGSV